MGGKNALEIYHPSISGFEDSLLRLRSHMYEKVTSTVKFALPEPVEKYIYDRHNLRFTDHGREIVYLQLKASCKSYGVGKTRLALTKFNKVTFSYIESS